MKPKPVRYAHNRAFRRQLNDKGKDLPPPAETSQEGGKLVMTIAGVRYIGKRIGGAFVWLAEDESS
jgi:hypothetical protein